MAQAAGPPSWGPAAESEELQAFQLKTGEHFDALTKIIGEAFARHDGSTIILMDFALRALLGIIIEGLGRHEVRIEVDNGDQAQ